MPTPKFESPTSQFKPGAKAAAKQPPSAAPVDDVVVIDPDSLPDLEENAGDLDMKRVPLAEQVDLEEEVLEKNTGGELKKAYCPRCQFDLSQDYAFKPTPEELQSYALSLLPGVGVRFSKQYKLASGLELGFRTLSPLELEAISNQSTLDRANEMPHILWLQRLDMYRLVWQIYHIKAPGQDPIVCYPVGTNNAAHSTPEKTLLPESLDWFQKEIITNESLMRVIFGCLRDFNMRVANMEALAADPDFYQGIAASA